MSVTTTTTGTAPRYEIVKASTGWEVIGRNYSGQVVEVQAVATREAARRVMATAKAMAADVAAAAQVAEHDALAQADQAAAQDRVDADAAAEVEAQEAMARVARAYELAAGVADLATDGPVKVTELDGELLDQAVAAAKAPKAPKAPKVVAPKGEVIVTRKLEAGHRITLRGVGVVTIVGRVKVDGQKFHVEYEDAAGTYGSQDMWANSRYRLAV